jgi:hypothetical protein
VPEITTINGILEIIKTLAQIMLLGYLRMIPTKEKIDRTRKLKLNSVKWKFT